MQGVRRVLATPMSVRTRSARLFDKLHAAYGGARSRSLSSTLLLATFGVSLMLIECNRRGWLPARLGHALPLNHFVAVAWSVELLLFIEVIELIFGLADSVAGALGKQLEIFALILLRKSFEELGRFSEPIDLTALLLPGLGPDLRHKAQSVFDISVDALGALGVFGGLVLYHRLQRHRRITSSDAELAQFVEGKKVIAVLLLALLGWLTVREAFGLFFHGGHFNIFSPLFTALIFSDIAIVFLSLRYTTHFQLVFRNFGFALVTVFVRLAITAPPLPRALMAWGVVLYASALSWMYDVSHVAVEHGEPLPARRATEAPVR